MAATLIVIGMMASYLFGAWSMHRVGRDYLDKAKAHLDEVEAFHKRETSAKP